MPMKKLEKSECENVGSKASKDYRESSSSH